MIYECEVLCIGGFLWKVMRKSIVKMVDFGGCFWICCIFFEGQNDEAQGFISDIKTYQFDGLRGHVVSVDILVKLIKNVSNRTGYVQTRSCKCLKRLLESENQNYVFSCTTSNSLSREMSAEDRETGTRARKESESNHQPATEMHPAVYLPTFVNINDLIALSSMGWFLFECLPESDRRLSERKYGKWALFLDKSLPGDSGDLECVLDGIKW